ncbi:MAG: hypothetical protein RLZZ612_1446 [Pseudomonadota bacterium]
MGGGQIGRDGVSWWRWLSGLGLAASLGLSGNVQAALPEAAAWVDVPAAALSLRAWWSPASATAATPVPRPVVLMLHGCGGMLNAQGQPTVRMRDYAQLLNAQGWHTLALDSFGPRGVAEICTQKANTRAIKVSDRAVDVWEALAWLAQQPEVDAQRLALLGWSNGGSTVLWANNQRREAMPEAKQRPHLRLAVAFYPGCASEAKRGYQPLAPTLLLLGLADDWTPANACEPLTHLPAVTRHAWADAHHGFDGKAAVKHRPEVPNGATPGAGVHVGGHPQARRESQAVLLQALREAFEVSAK